MDRDGVEVHKLAKKRTRPNEAILTEQAWSIKDLLYGFRGNFSYGTRRVVPSGQDSSILPARVANHRASHIINDSECIDKFLSLSLAFFLSFLFFIFIIIIIIFIQTSIRHKSK